MLNKINVCHTSCVLTCENFISYLYYIENNGDDTPKNFRTQSFKQFSKWIGVIFPKVFHWTNFITEIQLVFCDITNV
jgi:hypothetical protein